MNLATVACGLGSGTPSAPNTDLIDDQSIRKADYPRSASTHLASSGIRSRSFGPSDFQMRSARAVHRGGFLCLSQVVQSAATRPQSPRGIQPHPAI